MRLCMHVGSRPEWTSFQHTQVNAHLTVLQNQGLGMTGRPRPLVPRELIGGQWSLQYML